MTCDHQLLVRRDHPGGRLRAGGADAAAAAGIGVCIQVDAQPRRIPADALTNRRRVLADAGGEDQGVEPTERGGQRPQLASNSIDEEIDGLPGARVGALEERPHVARDARHAQQTRLLVDEAFDRACVHLLLVEQVEDHAGIQ